MMTFKKKLLTESEYGEPIGIAESSSPGTLLHTAIDGYIDYIDEVWLYGSNISNGDAVVTLEFGETASSTKINNTVSANSYKQLVPGIPLRGGAEIRAYTDAPNDINIFGWVNEIGPAGWSSFPLSLNAQAIYVSSSEGSDGYDGLSESTPKATVSAGVALLRDGFGDHLRFKRGDVWTGETISLSGISGESAENPMVFESYGDLSLERPLFRTGRDSGIILGFGSVHEFLVFKDLDFNAHFRDPEDPSFDTGIPFFDDSVGFNATSLGNNWLIEGCRFSHYGSGAVIQTLGPPEEPIDQVRINRCAFVDGYTLSANANGIYAFEVDNFTVEDSIIDYNRFENGSVFDHSLYYQNGSVGANTIFRNNIVTRGDGIQLREGGVCTNNLFERTWIAITVGIGNDATPIGVPINAQHNVILDGYDIDELNTRGWGFYIGNIDGYEENNQISNNILANNSGTGPSGISIDGDQTFDNGVESKIVNLTLDNNIVYNWKTSGFYIEGDGNTIQNMTVSDTVVRVNNSVDPAWTSVSASQLSEISALRNRFWTEADNPNVDIFVTGLGFQTYYEWEIQLADGYGTNLHEEVSYIDSTRSIARYNSEVLGRANSLEDFVEKRRSLRRGNWDTRYSAPAVNRWIRAGFVET